MKVSISHRDSSYNRATRKTETREVVDGFVVLPSEVETQLRRLAREYRFTTAQVVGLALSYYFGDGKNHLACEHCDWNDAACRFPAPGTQTTIPVLD